MDKSLTRGLFGPEQFLSSVISIGEVIMTLSIYRIETCNAFHPHPDQQDDPLHTPDTVLLPLRGVGMFLGRNADSGQQGGMSGRYHRRSHQFSQFNTEGCVTRRKF